jgi:flagellar hook protein FlgE
MDVIGNNIANVNTYGFKTYRVTFRDVLGQNTRSASAGSGAAAGNNPGSVGYGVMVGSIDRDMSMSSFQSTNKSLDLFISGDGFFVTTLFGSAPDGGTPLLTQPPQDVNLTRNGAFSIDSRGRLTTTDNRFVMGMQNSTAGLFQSGGNSTTILDEQTLGDNNNDNKITAADYTYENIIDINKLIQRAYNVHTDAAGLMYKYQMVTTPENENAQPIYEDPSAAFMEAMWADENGDGYMDADLDFNGKLSYTEELARVAAIAEERTMPDGTVYGAVAPPEGQTFERVACDKSGSIIQVNASNPINVTFGTEAVVIDNYAAYLTAIDCIERVKAGKALDTEPALTWEYGELTPQNVDECLSRLTNAAVDSANLKLGELTYKDLSSFTIEPSGTIMVNYNSMLKGIARLELGVVDNPEGLDQAGQTSYRETGASGVIGLKTPGDSGAGTIEAGKLEMSNVNLATEFSDMIVTQRGYQANSRIITVSDSMLEELVNLKR